MKLARQVAVSELRAEINVLLWGPFERGEVEVDPFALLGWVTLAPALRRDGASTGEGRRGKAREGEGRRGKQISVVLARGDAARSCVRHLWGSGRQEDGAFLAGSGHNGIQRSWGRALSLRTSIHFILSVHGVPESCSLYLQ